MGNASSNAAQKAGNKTTCRVSYETVLSLAGTADVIVISTLAETFQGCLIPHTVACSHEEKCVNDVLERKKQGLYTVIVYGENHLDPTVERKCAQMRVMGFKSIYMYAGGMFEWLLLHEVYGGENFPVAMAGSSRTCVPDILAFKPKDGLEHAGKETVAGTTSVVRAK